MNRQTSSYCGRCVRCKQWTAGRDRGLVRRLGADVFIGENLMLGGWLTEASDPYTPPERLAELANDCSPLIQEIVASNPSTPNPADGHDT